MSRYELGRLLFHVCRDRDRSLVTRYREDPESVLQGYDLSEAERRYLRDGDIRAIYEAGVPPLLVRMGLNGLLGPVDAATYRGAIAGAVHAQD